MVTIRVVEHWRETSRYATPTPVQDELIPLNVMIARIEAARMDAGPTRCPTCESSVDATRTRACYRCRETKPIEAFARHPGKKLDREYRCKACKRAEQQERDRERKRRQVRAIVAAGRAS